MIRFRYFSDRNYRYESLAFLKAMVVAVSPDVGSEDRERLMGDGARSTPQGKVPGFIVVAGPFMMMKITRCFVVDK